MGFFAVALFMLIPIAVAASMTPKKIKS